MESVETQIAEWRAHVAKAPAVKGRDLVAGLVEQAATADPTYLLDRTATGLEHGPDGVVVHLDDGTEVAAAADPGRLVLAHLYPMMDRLDLPALVAERWPAAREPGRLVVAHDGWSADV